MSDYGGYYGLTDKGARWFRQLENPTPGWEGPTLFGCQVCGATVAREALGADSLTIHAQWHEASGTAVFPLEVPGSD